MGLLIGKRGEDVQRIRHWAQRFERGILSSKKTNMVRWFGGVCSGKTACKGGFEGKTGFGEVLSKR